MMRPRELLLAEWRLYIDESGQFESADDEVTVGGLLVRSIRGGRPTAPLPFARGINCAVKASHFEVPIFLPLARSVSGSAAALDEETRKMLAVLDGPRLRRCVIALEHRRLPDLMDLKRLARLLRKEAPELWGLVNADWRQQSRTLRHAIRACLGDVGSPEFPSVAVFGAAEGVRGDATQVSPVEDIGTERYRTLLLAAIERAAWIAAANDGQHRLHVWVLERDVLNPEFGRTNLHLPVLAEWIRSLEPLLPPSIEIGTVAPPRPYRRDVRLEFVLADFIANRIRRGLLSSDELSEVEQLVASDLGLAPRSGAPTSRSHLAATGESLEWLRSLRGPGAAADPPSATVRAWAVEQALEWAS